jgi:uncharacterized Zn finger protein (UPF0148 family)
MRECKNKCSLYSYSTGIRNYEEGRKSCRVCSIFIKTNEIFCPCCGNTLAVKPRANKRQLVRRKERILELRLNRVHKLMKAVQLESVRNILERTL